MARNGNSYGSREAWRDFANSNQPAGSALKITFHSADTVKALTDIPPLLYSADDLLAFLTTTLREQYAFTPDDIQLIEGALEEFLQQPMPDATKQKFTEGWAAYKSGQPLTAVATRPHLHF